MLIVDQAHGAHLKFFDEGARKKRAAENLRADLVVNSTHKTLMSFTGTAILNVCSDRVDVSRISETVRMLQTTSPSYILMGSLDVNEKILRHGEELFRHGSPTCSISTRITGPLPAFRSSRTGSWTGVKST